MHICREHAVLIESDGVWETWQCMICGATWTVRVK
jgi:hypothetical protein